MTNRDALVRSFTRLITICSFLITSAAFADDVSDRNAAFFEKKIRPIFIQHCYECHSQKANKREGGLWLDRKASWETGGDSGPAVVPGDVEGSLLIESVRYESLEMPPKEKLSDDVVALLEEWVRRGAYDPRTAADSGKAHIEMDIDSGRKFWSFQPVKQHKTPSVLDQDWPRNAIDHFVLAKLEAANLKPAPDANREILLRRFTLALTGLPPTIAEQEAFLSDQSPDALEVVVDRLLHSMNYAERWARHWLDIVRYADTSGGGGSKPLPDAWRLRDYVIGSFYKDKPLNEMVRQHVAGDLLPYSNHAEQVDQLTATGFLVLGPHNYGGQDRELLALEIADEQIDTVGKAFLGMTISCARCHDHKFDPIPTSDYYAMAGIFLSTKSVANEAASVWFTRPIPRTLAQEAARVAKQAEIASLESEIANLKKQIASQSTRPDADKQATKQLDTNNKQTIDKLNAAIKQKESRLKELRENKEPVRPNIMCVGEREEAKNTTIRVRGQPRNLGATVSRGVLQVATPPSIKTPKIEAGSGRLELANWIASDNNPLTARVLANRIWQHLFGQGIVRTPDNFGTTGNLPTHPELLDYLARRLIKYDWSTRRLVREIVLSRTWQMASEHGDPLAAKLDPENKLRWRFDKRRLDAESLRDSILQLSGSLDMTRGGPSLPADFKSEFEFKHTSMKRSIYIPVFRNQPHEIFSVFDFANPSFVVGKRFESTLPTQSLYLMNSQFVHQQGRVAAEQLLGKLANPELDIVRTYRHILCRQPSDEEMKLTLEFLKSDDFSIEARSSLIRSLYSCVDFQYIH